MERQGKKGCCLPGWFAYLRARCSRSGRTPSFSRFIDTPLMDPKSFALTRLLWLEDIFLKTEEIIKICNTFLEYKTPINGVVAALKNSNWLLIYHPAKVYTLSNNSSSNGVKTILPHTHKLSASFVGLSLRVGKLSDSYSGDASHATMPTRPTSDFFFQESLPTARCCLRHGHPFAPSVRCGKCVFAHIEDSLTRYPSHRLIVTRADELRACKQTIKVSASGSNTSSVRVVPSV